MAVVQRVSGGRLAVEKCRDGDYYQVHDIECGKTWTLTRNQILQEFYKPGANLFGLEAVDLKVIMPQTQETRMLQWLKERFQQDELFFVKEVDPDFIERKNIKSVLLHLAQKGLLEHVETGIYSFPGAEFTKKKILNEALLNRRGIQIGHYFGKTFGAILGLCEEPDCLEVASNTQGEATAREKILYGIKVRIRLPKRPVTPNNYKVLAAFDFLHNSGKYCTAGKKEVHAAICRYLWDAPFSEYRQCGEATKISVKQQTKIMRAVIRHSDPAGTGEKIRAAMQEKKWTVLELAEALSYSVRAVYLWLEGKQMPGFDTIFRLAELFDMSLDDLVARSSWTA